jgi:hypothetical protein
MLGKGGHDLLPHGLQADDIGQEKKDDQQGKEKAPHDSRCPKNELSYPNLHFLMRVVLFLQDSLKDISAPGFWQGGPQKFSSEKEPLSCSELKAKNQKARNLIPGK